jgi:DNA-directed RNA polymerase specialized sigma24 family protein
MNRPRYTARAARSGRWWAIEVPEVEGAFTQARRLDQVESMAREAISLLLEIPEDSFEVVVEPDVASLGSLGRLIESARAQRTAAAAAQETASKTMREAVTQLRASGLSSREVGKLLGVTYGRVSQLERRAS